MECAPQRGSREVQCPSLEILNIQQDIALGNLLEVTLVLSRALD